MYSKELTRLNMVRNLINELKLQFFKRWFYAINEIIHVIRCRLIYVL